MIGMSVKRGGGGRGTGDFVPYSLQMINDELAGCTYLSSANHPRPLHRHLERPGYSRSQVKSNEFWDQRKVLGTVQVALATDGHSELAIPD